MVNTWLKNHEYTLFEQVHSGDAMNYCKIFFYWPYTRVLNFVFDTKFITDSLTDFCDNKKIAKMRLIFIAVKNKNEYKNMFIDIIKLNIPSQHFYEHTTYIFLASVLLKGAPK